MASYKPSRMAEEAHEVEELPDTNPVMREDKGRTGVIKKAGVEEGLGEFEKIDEGPNVLGLGGGDNFAKNNQTDGNGPVSTDRGKFEFKI